MINRVVINTKFFKHGLINRFSTSSDTSDPYYILGVQKNAEFSVVKKAFYKLANQYHPDKVQNTEETTNKFLLIKQAYQAIKMQKGITRPPGFVYDSDVKSMRPNPSQFQTDDEQNRRNNTDFKMHQQRAEAGGQQYEQFKGTFKTLNDINDIKIRVEKGEMKDASERFSLFKFKGKIQKYRQNGAAYYVFIGAGFVTFYMFLMRFQNRNSVEQLQKSIQNQDRKQSKRRLFDSEESKRQKYLEQINKDSQIKQYLQKRQNRISRKNYIGKKQEIATGENSV